MTTVLDKFTILPSTGSMVSEMCLVLVLFGIYLIYIVYLASYGTNYKPNFIMFLDFIFDNYSSADFQSYINNIVNDSKKENFTVNNTSIVENSKLWDNLKFKFNKLISMFFIKGNRISIIRI